MKITISKAKWESIGRQAGWLQPETPGQAGAASSAQITKDNPYRTVWECGQCKSRANGGVVNGKAPMCCGKPMTPIPQDRKPWPTVKIQVAKGKTVVAQRDDTKVVKIPGSRSIIDLLDASGRTQINGETIEQIRKRYPNAVVSTLGEHLWETFEAQNTPIHWAATTEEKYDEMLGALPPADTYKGGFLVGEPFDHCARTGRPRYEAYRKSGDAYWVSDRPMTVADFRAEMDKIVGNAASAGKPQATQE